MSNENPFDYTASEGAPSADNESTATATVPADEPKEEEKKPEKNDFDYSDAIVKMEEDADVSGEDGTPDDASAESDSDASAEKPAESDTSAQKATEEQLFQAAQLGLTLDDVRGLNSNELATAIRVAEKLKPADSSNAEPEDKKEDDSFFKPISLDDMGLDEYDEDTQNLVKGLQTQFNENMERMAETLKQTQQTLTQSQEATMQQNQAQFYNWFDKQVEGLGEDWNDVFGGDPDMLQQGSPEVQNRIKVIEEMDKLATSHPEYDQQKLFDVALKVAFTDELINKKEQATKKKQSKYRQNRSTMKPTNRNRSIENMPEGREKALAMVKDLGKKKKFFGLF